LISLKNLSVDDNKEPALIDHYFAEGCRKVNSMLVKKVTIIEYSEGSFLMIRPL
jgi:hypothetical protein